MKTSSSPRRDRGSLLIVAMVFSAVMGVILASYVKMSTTALNLSQRAFCENSAMNLTESGLELAMSAINANSWPSPWTTASGNATATFTGFSVGQNMTGSVKVFVQNYAGSAPLVVAKGIVAPATGTSVYKMVEVSGIVQRSLFAKGLVGRNGVSFSGNNASVDSWDSNPTAAAAGSYSPVAYSSNAAVRHDHGSIAAVSITATDAVGNANIWGSASVGGTSTSLITVGPNGSVGPFGTASGRRDANSISANFTANLPNISAPTPASAAYVLGAIGSTSLPRAGDVAQDGKYYYSVSSLSMNGNASNVLNITSGNVVLLFTTASGSSAIDIGGNASIAIASGANLSVYTAGNISIAGNGVSNGNSNSSTTSFQVWGTNTTAGGQSISVSGNGVLAGTVYAPNASLSAKGGGNSGAIYGAFVANSVTITGNDAFHYDENLGRQGNAGNFNPSKWRELTTSSDRATYASYF